MSILKIRGVDIGFGADRWRGRNDGLPEKYYQIYLFHFDWGRAEDNEWSFFLALVFRRPTQIIWSGTWLELECV